MLELLEVSETRISFKYEYYLKKISSYRVQKNIVSSTNTNQLTLLRENKIVVYSKNHTNPTNPLCAQNVDIFYVKADG
jgi:hypothetical protein